MDDEVAGSFYLATDSGPVARERPGRRLHGKRGSARTRLVNDDHWPGENCRTAPAGLRESRTSTDCPALAISTHSVPLALYLLVRQSSVQCWLCRPGIQHPSVQRATVRRVTRDEVVEPAGVNGLFIPLLPPPLSTFLVRSVNDLPFSAYTAISFSVPCITIKVYLSSLAGLECLKLEKGI